MGGGGERADVTQRKGMGLLEYYQAMPSFMPDGCVHIHYITVAGNSISSQLGSSCLGFQYGTVKKGGTARPSRTKSHAVTSPHTHAGGIRYKLCEDDFLHWSPSSSMPLPFLSKELHTDSDALMLAQAKFIFPILVCRIKMTEIADTAEKIAELINDKERLAKYRWDSNFRI